MQEIRQSLSLSLIQQGESRTKEKGVLQMGLWDTKAREDLWSSEPRCSTHEYSIVTYRQATLINTHRWWCASVSLWACLVSIYIMALFAAKKRSNHHCSRLDTCWNARLKFSLPLHMCLWMGGLFVVTIWKWIKSEEWSSTCSSSCRKKLLISKASTKLSFTQKNMRWRHLSVFFRLPKTEFQN